MMSPGAGDQQSGVVVEDVEDLHFAAVGQHPVGDVGLPQLIGQLGAAVRCGLVCGRREHGSNAASPCASYRATSFCTQRRETP